MTFRLMAAAFFGALAFVSMGQATLPDAAPVPDGTPVVVDGQGRAPIITVRLLLAGPTGAPVLLQDVSGSAGLRWVKGGATVFNSAVIEHGVLRAYELRGSGRAINSPAEPGTYTVMFTQIAPFNDYIIVSGEDVELKDLAKPVSQDLVLRVKGLGHLTMTVTDASSGKGVPEMSVVLASQEQPAVPPRAEARTDKAGVLDIEKLREGTYSAVIKGAGYKQVQTEIKVLGETKISLKLEARRALEVKVTDEAGHAVTKGDVILLMDDLQYGMSEHHGKLGADGVAKIGDLPDGEGRLMVVDGDMVTYAERVRIARDESMPIKLGPRVALGGSLLHDAGVAVRAVVFVRKGFLPGGQSAVNATGGWKLELIPGEYEVYAEVQSPQSRGYFKLQDLKVAAADAGKVVELRSDPGVKGVTQEEIYGDKPRPRPTDMGGQ